MSDGAFEIKVITTNIMEQGGIWGIQEHEESPPETAATTATSARVTKLVASSYHWLLTHIQAILTYLGICPRSLQWDPDHKVKHHVMDVLIQQLASKDPEEQAEAHGCLNKLRKISSFAKQIGGGISIGELQEAVKKKKDFDQTVKTQLLKKIAVQSSLPIDASKADIEARIEEWISDAPPQSHEERQEAARKLRIFIEGTERGGGVSELNLSSLNLSSLPSILHLPCFSRLTVLKLNMNQFSALPDHIGALHNLESLHAASNFLQEIPVEICNLTNLRFLGLHSNRIDHLPKDIGNLHALKILDMSNNPLLELPRSIGSCIELKEINLMFTHITSLPVEISQLPKLESLDLRQNPFLKGLPNEIMQLLSTCQVILESHFLRSTVADALKAEMQAQNYQGPQFSINPHDNNQKYQDSEDLRSLADLLKFLSTETEQPQWEHISGDVITEELLRKWLSRFLFAHGCRSMSSTDRLPLNMLKSIVNYLSLADQNPTFRTTMAQIMTEAISSAETVGDLSLVQLASAYEIATATDAATLAGMLTGRFIMERIAEIAGEKSKKLQFFEAADIHLAYLIGLQKEFDLHLPLQESIVHDFAVNVGRRLPEFRCSAVTNADLKTATATINGYMRTRTDGVEFLIRQKEWQTFLKKTYPTEYQEVEPTHSKLLELTRQILPE